MTYTIDPDRLAEVLDPDFTIKHGAHDNPDDGMCELEAVAAQLRRCLEALET